MSESMCPVDGCTKPRGSRKRFCTMHTQRWSRYKTFDLPPVQGPPSPPAICRDPTCARPARGLGLCVVHYMRLRRNGNTGLTAKPPIGQRTVRPNGYVLVYMPGHPLAMNSNVYEHRHVMYEIHGLGPHRCHWCSTHINWRAGLEVDHLDYNTSNNAPTNLVLSCHGCNTRRARHRNQHSK